MIYRVDLHVHTTASLDARASLNELVRAARRAGIDAIAITDHNACTPVPMELNGVLLIPGCEISTQGGQILGVFLEQPIDLTALCRHGLPSANEAVLAIHHCGGLAILSQPFLKKDADPALFPLRPDAVETVNARAAALSQDANKRALLWATEHDRPRTGGSNAHCAQEVGNAYTELSCPRLSRALLKEALDLGRCRPVYVRSATQTACGYSALEFAKRGGSARQILKCTAMLGLCRLADLTAGQKQKRVRKKKKPEDGKKPSRRTRKSKR